MCKTCTYYVELDKQNNTGVCSAPFPYYVKGILPVVKADNDWERRCILHTPIQYETDEEYEAANQEELAHEQQRLEWIVSKDNK